MLARERLAPHRRSRRALRCRALRCRAVRRRAALHTAVRPRPTPSLRTILSVACASRAGVRRGRRQRRRGGRISGRRRVERCPQRHGFDDGGGIVRRRCGGEDVRRRRRRLSSPRREGSPLVLCAQECLAGRRGGRGVDGLKQKSRAHFFFLVGRGGRTWRRWPRHRAAAARSSSG